MAEKPQLTDPDDLALYTRRRWSVEGVDHDAGPLELDRLISGDNLQGHEDTRE